LFSLWGAKWPRTPLWSSNCVDKMKETGERCPWCKHAKNTTRYSLPGEDSRRYCAHINGGFSGSSKPNEIVDWHQNEVPQGDKVLILSFYKASLDLLEGIFFMTAESIVLVSMVTLIVIRPLLNWNVSSRIQTARFSLLPSKVAVSDSTL
jgi:hypothetical protein